MLVERLALRPMLGKPVFTLAIITIGVDIVLRIVANRYIGVQSRIIEYPGGSERFSIGGVSISHQRLGLIAVTAVTVTALAMFFQYSRTGLAMRATALDQETALAQGIRVGAVFALAWAIAGGLAAIAGTFVAAGNAGIEQTSWVIALKALAGDHHRRPRLGAGRGHRRARGRCRGGAHRDLPAGRRAVARAPTSRSWRPYALMFVVLLVRPYGLFGTKEVERV